MASRLRVSVVLPEDSVSNRCEIRLLVDGQDLVDPAFQDGPMKDPDALLGPDSPLLPGPQPREVMLAEAECLVGCCGALFVRVRRDGDHVVWDQWRNPYDKNLSLPTVRFAPAQYEAELARADRERDWEWPARTVARLLRARLRAEPGVLHRWHSSLNWTSGTYDHVAVSFTSPPRHVVAEHRETTGEDMAYTQFVTQFPVNAQPAHRQAEHILAQLRDTDPRATAEACGGYSPPR